MEYRDTKECIYYKEFSMAYKDIKECIYTMEIARTVYAREFPMEYRDIKECTVVTKLKWNNLRLRSFFQIEMPL